MRRGTSWAGQLRWLREVGKRGRGGYYIKVLAKDTLCNNLAICSSRAILRTPHFLLSSPPRERQPPPILSDRLVQMRFLYCVLWQWWVMMVIIKILMAFHSSSIPPYAFSSPPLPPTIIYPFCFSPSALVLDLIYIYKGYKKERIACVSSLTSASGLPHPFSDHFLSLALFFRRASCYFDA